MDRKIIVSCDTTIAMSKSKIDELGLNVIPLNTIADGVEYHDTVDIDAEKLCELMRNGAKISTSTPTIGEIEEYFDRLFEESKADVIIHFTISSKLSSMFSLFTTVCEERYGDKVKVIDSHSICCFMANQVLYAKQLVEEGLDVNEIIEKVSELKDKESVIFIPESLEYLKRGGRISPAVATIANLIGVLPILTFKDGVVGKQGVTRTVKKAFMSNFEEWNKNIPSFKEDYVLVVLSASDDFEKINKAKEIIDIINPGMEIIFRNLSLNVTAHTGPGVIGLGIMKKY